MNRLLIVLTGLMLGLSGVALAQQVQCPGGTEFVGIGDSLAAVIAKCGKPKTIKTHRYSDKNAVQKWTYTMPGAHQRLSGQGVSILVVHNQVKAIEMDGRGRIPYMLCAMGPVTAGVSAKRLEEVCGPPMSKTTYNPSYIPGMDHNTKKPAEITQLVYQPQSYLPETTFLFINGRLSKILGQ